MVKLDCSVIGCAYNNNNSCRREDITVGGHEAHKSSETACKSFAPKGTNTLVNACGGAKKETKVACDAKKETKVACDAVNCKYNEAKVCHADHIGIAGRHAVTNGETECGTFMER